MQRLQDLGFWVDVAATCLCCTRGSGKGRDVAPYYSLLCSALIFNDFNALDCSYQEDLFIVLLGGGGGGGGVLGFLST